MVSMVWLPETLGARGPCAAHRSCVSRRRLRLVRLAMRPLAASLRAGPALIDVFSSAVVRSEILFPLCEGGHPFLLFIYLLETGVLLHSPGWPRIRHLPALDSSVCDNAQCFLAGGVQ